MYSEKIKENHILVMEDKKRKDRMVDEAGLESFPASDPPSWNTGLNHHDEKANAFELVQQYISGWKKNNLQLITDCLTENCVVIESHGPIYHGIKNIKQWFEFWSEAKSTVLKWDILSFSFCEKDQTAFCEWDFACISNSIEYAFQGISLVKLSGQKIAFIHEYRMTHSTYEWKGNKLKSE